jgi:hypothetical protein
VITSIEVAGLAKDTIEILLSPLFVATMVKPRHVVTLAHCFIIRLVNLSGHTAGTGHIGSSRVSTASGDAF